MSAERSRPRLPVPPGAIPHGTDAELALAGAPLHHLRDVLHLGPGEEVELYDGAGRAALARIESVARSAARLVVLSEVEAAGESPLELTLAVALPRAAKLDWIVEKATEIGVTRLVPFASARSARAREGGESRLERWRRIAAAAAAQSGRPRAPEIASPEAFARLLERSADLRIFFWEGETEPLRRIAASAGRPRHVLVATGAEGGFSAAEVESARGAGFRPASLGPRVLRAETAAVVAAAVAQSIWGDLG